MLNRQAVGIFVVALALPAYADIPLELMHRLDQYPEVIHTLNQHPEVIHRLNQHPDQHTLEQDSPLELMHRLDQHSGSDVVELKPLVPAQIWMRMNAKADVAYTTICRMAGVTVVFDPDFRPQKLTIALSNVSVREALDLVGLLSKTVWRAVTPQTIFVYSKETR